MVRDNRPSTGRGKLVSELRVRWEEQIRELKWTMVRKSRRCMDISHRASMGSTVFCGAWGCRVLSLSHEGSVLIHRTEPSGSEVYVESGPPPEPERLRKRPCSKNSGEESKRPIWACGFCSQGTGRKSVRGKRQFQIIGRNNRSMWGTCRP